MNKQLEHLCKAIEKHRDLMWDAEKYIWEHPELGFKEWQTHAYLKENMEKLGYTLKEAGDIPGFTAEIDTGKEGPTVVVIAEMDSIVNFSHPACNEKILLFAVVCILQFPNRHPVKMKISGETVNFFQQFG